MLKDFASLVHKSSALRFFSSGQSGVRNESMPARTFGHAGQSARRVPQNSRKLKASPANHQLSHWKKWCPGPELNQRHCDFQSHALPTELPGHLSAGRSPGRSRALIGGLSGAGKRRLTALRFNHRPARFLWHRASFPDHPHRYRSCRLGSHSSR